MITTVSDSILRIEILGERFPAVGGRTPSRVYRSTMFNRYVLLLAATVVAGFPQATRAPQEPEDPTSRNEWFLKQRSYPLGYIPTKARLDAIRTKNRLAAQSGERQVKHIHSQMTSVSSTQWTLIEPQATGQGAEAVSGHVAALAVDPRNANVVYLGGADGGVWKTTDGGADWTPLTDSQPSLSIGALAVDPSKPDIVYAGTGNPTMGDGSGSGVGILKSTNGGTDWANFPGPFVSNTYSIGIYSIAVHPTDGQVLLVGSTEGIFRSADGGVTWTKVLSGGVPTRVLFNPANGSMAYAALSYGPLVGAYLSTDGGLTWNSHNGTSPNTLQVDNAEIVELALAASNPSILYANITSPLSETNTVFYKTIDGGSNWVPITLPVPSCSICVPPSSGGPYCTGQCWFDNVMAVDPANPNIVLAGGYDPFITLDGGSTWTDIFFDNADYNGVHVDQHAIAYASDGSKVYLGDDGGVWSTTNVSTTLVNWDNLNNTLALTQFYPGLAIHPSDVNRAWGGT